MPKNGPLFLLSLLLLLGCTLGSCERAQNVPPESRPPNIVLVLVDDLGWMDLGVQGNPWYPTPNIDRLATEGVRFTNYYAPSPVCSPSRAAMMSGLSPARTGITDFIPGHWRPYEELTVPTNRTQYLPRRYFTYAEALKTAGYRTAYYGKWHLGWDKQQHGPGTQGFDEYHVRGGWGHFIPPVHFTPTYPVDTGRYEPDILTDMTLDFISENRDTHFLAVLSHFAVHVPLDAPDEMIDAMASRPQPADRIYNPTYVAMLKSVDDNLGRLVHHVDSLGLGENTLIVFTSDNGGLRQIFNKSDGVIATTNAPLREEKGTLYEGGIRVPLILRQPGRIPAGTVTDVPATGLDLYPTFLAEAGGVTADSLPTLDGRSLVPVYTEGTYLNRRLYFHYPHYHHGEPAAALRASRYKLIKFFDRPEPELYDLEEDLGETNDLATVDPELAASLLRELDAWLAETEAPLPTLNPNFVAERRAEWGPRPK